MAQQKKNGIFASFLFTDDNSPNDSNTLNIQFSVENNKMGLDWVMTSPRTTHDKELFRSTAEQNGYTVENRQENGVSYLRVENGDLLNLCGIIVTDEYGLKPTDEMLMIFEGFIYKTRV